MPSLNPNLHLDGLLTVDPTPARLQDQRSATDQRSAQPVPMLHRGSPEFSNGRFVHANARILATNQTPYDFRSAARFSD